MPYYLKERVEEVKHRELESMRYRKELPIWQKRFLTWIFLFTIWMLITGNPSLQNIIIGWFVVHLISFIRYENLSDDLKLDVEFIDKLMIFLYIPKYIVLVIFRLIESNIQVAKYALFMDIEPSIVKIESDLISDSASTILANSITLTPSTLTLEVDNQMDNTYFYVHWLKASHLDTEKAAEDIKGDMERCLKKIFY